MFDVRYFEPRDLDEVLALCAAEGWLSWTEDRARALRALTADGVTAVVALDEGAVVGFAQMLSDGELQAYLANLVVARRVRCRGIARALIAEALHQAGGDRVDLLSEHDATRFYERFAHRRKPGFRIYPFLRGPERDR